ncbi:MAG: cytochrome c-type biosis protein CcmH [Solirubrobacterales bacterium]|jgi:cytochrome c-type biogenesis protein CcmH|nr:cytochrome c-type biosis protein CcmH [Solirubrobacterales bacterium]
MRRLAVVLALGALLVAASSAPAAEPQASLPDIEDEVMCIVCGVPLELATEAPQAIQERDFIRHLIAQGLTKDEIKDRLVAEFGPEVLAIPSDSGFDLAAWLVPGVAILCAAGAILVGLRRWRRAGTTPNGGGSAVPGDNDPVDPEDSERLDADLARYEL